MPRTILGVFSRGTNTAIDLVANMIYDGIMPGEKLMADAGVSESEVLGAMAIQQMGKMDEGESIQFPTDVGGCDKTIKGMVNIDTEHLMEAAKNGTRHGGVYRDAIGKKKKPLKNLYLHIPIKC